MSVKKAEFEGAIAQTKNGLSFGADDARVQFDIPRSELAETIKLATMRGKLLKITVEVIDGRAEFQERKGYAVRKPNEFSDTDGDVPDIGGWGKNAPPEI